MEQPLVQQAAVFLFVGTSAPWIRTGNCTDGVAIDRVMRGTGSRNSDRSRPRTGDRAMSEHTENRELNRVVDNERTKQPQYRGPELVELGRINTIEGYRNGTILDGGTYPYNGYRPR